MKRCAGSCWKNRQWIARICYRLCRRRQQCSGSLLSFPRWTLGETDSSGSSRWRRNSGKSAATTQLGKTGILHGSKSLLMQTEDGQVVEPHSISAGLDYPGIGPCMHTCLRADGQRSWVQPIRRLWLQPLNWPNWKASFLHWKVLMPCMH